GPRAGTGAPAGRVRHRPPRGGGRLAGPLWRRRLGRRRYHDVRSLLRGTAPCTRRIGPARRPCPLASGSRPDIVVVSQASAANDRDRVDPTTLPTVRDATFVAPALEQKRKPRR